MKALPELIRLWTEALIPVCNHSRSHASQEMKWLLQHARVQVSAMNAQESRDPSRFKEGAGVGQVPERVVSLMQSYVEQRVNTRKPLQYILGTQPFMNLEILARPPTLIPRWETEEWTTRLADALKKEPSLFRNEHVAKNLLLDKTSKKRKGAALSPFNILDICTGSGCIPLGLASALPSNSCNLLGVDIHPKAIQLATENEIHNRPLLNGNQVKFLQEDLLAPHAADSFLDWLHIRSHHNGSSLVNDGIDAEEAVGPIGARSEPRALGALSEANPHLSTGYNLIVSNPPYIAVSEYDTLEPEVARWEDANALLADEEGLAFYPRIADMAMELLHNYRSSLLSNVSPLNTSSYGVEPSETSTSYVRQWRNGPDLDHVKIPELVFEIGGDHQAHSVCATVRQAGFSRVEVWRDLADRARCVVGAR
ncbi:hypothetical protein EDD11_004855 [Mortierella claussenii]|nr:hypothetical protein EDD11_004855 [Mortierella claussenii]